MEFKQTGRRGEVETGRFFSPRLRVSKSPRLSSRPHVTLRVIAANLPRAPGVVPYTELRQARRHRRGRRLAEVRGTGVRQAKGFRVFDEDAAGGAFLIEQ